MPSPENGKKKLITSEMRIKLSDSEIITKIVGKCNAKFRKWNAADWKWSLFWSYRIIPINRPGRLENCGKGAVIGIFLLKFWMSYLNFKKSFEKLKQITENHYKLSNLPLNYKNPPKLCYMTHFPTSKLGNRQGEQILYLYVKLSLSEIHD